MYQISLDNADGKFLAGSKIVGYVNWQGISEKADRIEIRLIWYTQGKGDRDFQINAAQTIATPGTNGESNFEFLAPARPYSFSGKLISLSWAIEVVEFPSLEATRKEITLSKTGEEVSLYVHALDSN